jgi:hypothetical protein
MSQPNLIEIGTTGDVLELPAFGRTFTIRWEDGLYREERASDGTARRDVIARKRNFTLGYDICDQDLVDRMEELFQEDSELILRVTHLTTTTTYNVLMAPFERERLLAVAGGMWSGLTVELKEV